MNVSRNFLRIKLHINVPGNFFNHKSWFLFDNVQQCRLVSDLERLIAEKFNLSTPGCESFPVRLMLDGFLLPSSANIHLVRDNDEIHVRKSSALDVEGSDGATCNKEVVDKRKRKFSNSTQQTKKTKFDKNVSTKQRKNDGAHIYFNDSEDESINNTPLKDYSAFSDFTTLPKAGDKIGFKVIELSSNYLPVLSHYKEGTMISSSPANNTVLIKLSEDTIKVEKLKMEKQSSGKFALPDSDPSVVPIATELEINFNELVEPKKLN